MFRSVMLFLLAFATLAGCSDSRAEGVQNGKLVVRFSSDDPVEVKTIPVIVENEKVELGGAASRSVEFEYLDKLGGFDSLLGIKLGVPVPDIEQCSKYEHAFACGKIRFDSGDWVTAVLQSNEGFSAQVVAFRIPGIEEDGERPYQAYQSIRGALSDRFGEPKDVFYDTRHSGSDREPGEACSFDRYTATSFWESEHAIATVTMKGSNSQCDVDIKLELKGVKADVGSWANL